jgi:DNA (cytosine-5)-methyltransferase 1
MNYQIPLDNEIIVDNFAGGGGASCGIEQALKRPVNVAINHDPEALQMHEVNHPLTKHFCEDVWNIDPVKVCDGRKIALAWFSPDCKHFSKAKGGKPVEKKIRGLAWVVMKWASLPVGQKPRVICLENVEEFTTWGPLTIEGMPDAAKKGDTFRSFINALKRQGYIVEWKELRACDYGAPTIRKRLFLVARCDGNPVVWPKPTHAQKDKAKALKLKPWRTAAECIDWSIPAPSIFAEGRKLLAENTLRRVAKGFKKFVLESERPFIVNLTHGGREESLDEPFKTITGANRGEKALVSPYLTEHANASTLRVFNAQEPLRTQCAQVKGGHFALISPYLAGVGGRMGQSEPRDVHEQPVQTITAKADTVIVTPYVVGAGGAEFAGKPRSAEDPLNVITAHNRSAIIAPTLIEIGYGEREGQEPRAPGLDKPLGTVVAGGIKHAVVAAYLAQHNSQREGVNPGRKADEPLAPITTTGKQIQLVEAFMTSHYGTSTGSPADEPLHTATAKNKHALTSAYLVKYYGNEKEAHGMEHPMGTVTTKDRFGLVQVEGLTPPLSDDQRYNAWVTLRMLEQFGAIEHVSKPYNFDLPRPRPAFLMLGDYILVDIGMRMLAPRELYRAQGFPDSYIIDRTSFGAPITKTAQVRMCGNSVSPVLAKAIVAANVKRSTLHHQREREYA